MRLGPGQCDSVGPYTEGRRHPWSGRGAREAPCSSDAVALLRGLGSFVSFSFPVC